MIFTDKDGNETNIKLTEVFKKRVRLYVQKAFDLPKCPTNKGLKQLFPKFSDLRLAMNWMHIFKLADEMIENAEAAPSEYSPMNLQKAFENVRKNLAEHGLYESKCDTFMGRSSTFGYRGETMGKIGYNSMNDTFYVAFGRQGSHTPIKSLDVAVATFISRVSAFK